MRPVLPAPVQLGPAHCCVCASERGTACYHIGPVQLCDPHARQTTRTEVTHGR